ncbi:MAG TPA: hypothetical protein VJ900_02435 [Patescibacteria group bacterium]|nr:hypothetical protein [Patescibacteria group bacterium]
MDNLEEIKTVIKEFEKVLDEAGMVGKAREKLMLGEEIITCPYCKTYNCYSKDYNKKENWERFQCSNCGRNHIRFYDKK